MQSMCWLDNRLSIQVTTRLIVGSKCLFLDDKTTKIYIYPELFFRSIK